MGKPELLKALRTQIGEVTASSKEFWKAPHFEGGVAKGIVAELLGNARTEWLIQLFLLHSEHFIFWCERDPSINPTALHQRGLELKRIKFLNCAGDLQQPLRLALETKHYPFIIAPSVFKDVTSYQRLSLLAEKSKATVFLLADKSFSSAWPISLQLEINFARVGLNIQIQRQRHSGGT